MFKKKLNWIYCQAYSIAVYRNTSYRRPCIVIQIVSPNSCQYTLLVMRCVISLLWRPLEDGAIVSHSLTHFMCSVIDTALNYIPPPSGMWLSLRETCIPHELSLHLTCLQNTFMSPLWKANKSKYNKSIVAVLWARKSQSVTNSIFYVTEAQTSWKRYAIVVMRNKPTTVAVNLMRKQMATKEN